MPFLSMVRRALLVRRRLTQRFSLSTQNRRRCRLGMERRFWVASENRWVKLRLSPAALRTIDKNGIDAVLADLRARGEHV